ncbi:MAG TPA: cytochrome c oxidase subunit II [Nocardioidaceae bacterium]|nr:cytochrome c oxidase subunit II [Nocardioidaceae bacterium]
MAAVILSLLSLPLLAGCSEAEVGELTRLGLPEPANSSAPHMLELWIGAWIAAGVVGVLVWGLIIWAVVRYRRRSDDEVPVQVRYNLPIEALYTIAPFVAIFVLFYHTVVAQEAILAEHESVDHEVLVVGQQWSWTFNYLGEDGIDEGPGGNDVFTVGTVAEPPTLVLPVGETVKFRLRSPDVIHSFWIPAYYFKMDVIPGRENSWITTPTETGTFDGRCAELCGLQHSRMLFSVKVVEPAEYEEYLAALEARGNTGIANGSTQADEIVGLEEDAEPEEVLD